MFLFVFWEIFSLKDASDFIEEHGNQDFDDFVDQIFIQPPENEGFESGEDDVEDENLPDNVCPGQLKAGCEITLRSGRRIANFEEIEVDVVEEEDFELGEDGADHLVQPIANRRRCAGDNCKSSVRSECAKCNVGLCLPCFAAYHTQGN